MYKHAKAPRFLKNERMPMSAALAIGKRFLPKRLIIKGSAELVALRAALKDQLVGRGVEGAQADHVVRKLLPVTKGLSFARASARPGALVSGNADQQTPVRGQLEVPHGQRRKSDAGNARETSMSLALRKAMQKVK